VTSRPRSDSGHESGVLPYPLVLELSLADGDPVSGTIGIAGRPPATTFHGWIDLMSAINTLRAAAGDPA